MKKIRSEYKENPEYRDKRLKQSFSDKEKRKEYNKAWFQKNKEKVKEYRKATAEKRNRRIRELYAQNENIRNKAIIYAAKWKEKNPEGHFASRLRMYGLTLEQYRKMLKDQDGACAICGKKELPDVNEKPARRGRRVLSIDHCHETGMVRGLLCFNCNHGLGKFCDNPEIIEKALIYIKKFKNK